MKQTFSLAVVAMMAMAVASCDEETETIGSSITNSNDELIVTSTSYEAQTRTFVADSVLSLANTCYFGKVKDPETESDVTSEFSTQFHLLENTYIVAEEDIVGRAGGRASADSCDLILYIESPFKSDNNLTAMKLRVRELKEPLAEKRYYSNFDPVKEGLIRTDGLDKSKVFCYTDMTVSDSLRSATNYLNSIHITLNQPYTDTEGNTYTNYGTYLMHQYYDHPEYFSNSYQFAQNVCPGFFFEVTDGIGFYSQVTNIGLRVYYTYEESNTTKTGQLTLAGTQEVLQTVHVKNDMNVIRNLAEETDYTYLKTPAGLFTEVTLPVSDIKASHKNDSLISTKIVFQRLNNLTTDARMFSIPQTLLMVQRDSVYTFFENNKLPDNITSFVSSYGTSNPNCYTYSNISNLITELWRLREEGMKEDPEWEVNHPNWNKVALVPVSVTTTSSTVTRVENSMALASTRLVGGQNQPITVNVVYAKFK